VPGAGSTNIHFAAGLARNRNQANYSPYLDSAGGNAPRFGIPFFRGKRSV